MLRKRSLWKLCRGLMMLGIMLPLNVVWADSESLDARVRLQADLEQALPGLHITHVSQQEVVPGWMQLDVETKSGHKVIYADPSGRYVLVGSIFDLKTGHNMTRERLVEQRERIFATIDWSMAIVVTVQESEQDTFFSQHPLLYFTDPDCPYCQRFQPELQKVIDAGYPVAVMLYPNARLHPDAPRKARSIWCAKDQMGALASAFREEKVADPDPSCPVVPLKEIRDLAQAFGITGTPSLVLPSGEVIRGFQRAESILTWLERSIASEKPPYALKK